MVAYFLIKQEIKRSICFWKKELSLNCQHCEDLIYGPGHKQLWIAWLKKLTDVPPSATNSQLSCDMSYVGSVATMNNSFAG